MNNLPYNTLSDSIWIGYLRKSRDEIQTEKKDTNFKVLERHKKRLEMISKAADMPIAYWYEEVVSGDNIKDRPEIQKLLKDIENPNIKGVWVVDIQRLCRGDLGDQDKIIKSFKYTNTLILTPDSEYNLTRPSDEERLIDKLAYSRKEYKEINSRLSNGRMDSILEGNYPGGEVLYGYETYKIRGEKGYKYKIVKQEYDVKRRMLKLLRDGYGIKEIADKLNEWGIPTKRGTKWTYTRVRLVLINKLNIGILTWGKETTKTYMENGEIKKKTIWKDDGDYLEIKGDIPRTFNDEEYEFICKCMNENSEKFIGNKDGELKNPLAGLIYCYKCGNKIQRQSPNKKFPNSKGYVYCKNKCVMQTPLKQIEKCVLSEVKMWLEKNKPNDEYQANAIDEQQEYENSMIFLNNQIAKLQDKLNRMFDYLEEGLYTKEQFIERSTPIKEQIKSIELDKVKLENENKFLKKEKIKSLVPKVEKFLSEYDELDIKTKNEMFKLIIKKIIYNRITKDNIELNIYMKL